MDDYELELAEKIDILLTTLISYAKGRNEHAELRRAEFRIVRDNVTGQTSDQSHALSQSNSNLNGSILEIQTLEDEQMKYLTKRADGLWQGRKTINGRRICVYAKTQKECAAKLKNAAKNPQKPRKSTWTLHGWALHFLKTYKKPVICENSYKNYMYLANKHLSGKQPLTSVTTDELQQLINALPPTRNGEMLLILIKQIFRKAFEIDLIKKDVAQFVVKRKIERKEKPALNYEEQKALLAAVRAEDDEDFYIRVMIYLLTGCRPNEAHRITEVKDGYLFIDGTKTRAARRWVKVSTKFSDVLKARGPEIFEFDSHWFKKRLQAVMKGAGLKPCDVYTLRHTFASNLYYMRVPDKERAAYMGHTSTDITNDVYTTLDPTTSKGMILELYDGYYPDYTPETP